jgi:hypothetical protein
MATTFVDKIYTQEVLRAFTAGLAPLNAFSKSYSPEARRKGDAIIIPRVDALSTTTFAYANNSGSPYETEGGVIAAITLNLDQHQIVGVDITDVQYASSGSSDIINFAQNQGRALARKCIGNIFGLLSIANFGNAAATAVSIANTGLTQIRAARKTLVDRQVPMENVSLVASSELYQSLLGDSNVTNAFNFGGSEAVREARIPRLYGMNTYETNALPLGGTLSLIGFLAHPDSIALAVRTLQPQDAGDSYLAVETVVDEETGLGFTYRRHFNPGKGRHFASVECLFGFATALTLGIGLLRKAD